MLRRALIVVLLVIPVFAQGQGKAKGHGKEQAVATPAATGPVFSSQDRTVLLGYYGPRFASLPPGQQKQLIRKGTLPPGIAKKLAPLPPDIERRLPPPPTGCRRVVYDQWALLINDASNSVFDIIDLAKH